MSDIKDILNKLLDKKISIQEAERLLRANHVEEVGDLAKLDIFRKTRTGMPEVIYAQNKTPQVIIDISEKFLESKKFAIISRYSDEQKTKIEQTFEKSTQYDIDINELGKIMVIKDKSYNFPKKGGIVGIVEHPPLYQNSL